MNLKQLIQFGIENSQEPVIKNPILRAALEEPRTMAQGGRIGLFEAGLVTQGENANQWRVNNFYSKTKEGKFQPPKGKSRDAFFNSEKEALAAIEKRKKESSHGLSLEELNKKYKKQLKTYGVSSWDKLDNNIRADRLTKQKIKQAYLDEKFPPESVAKWKKEGLTTGLNEKTRKLLATKKPINPATGLPYTLKEFTDLGRSQKNILLRRLEGKESTRAWAVRQGWYPEKKANKLMTYLKQAAKKQENLPLKERNFINVWEGEKFIGVRDVRKNTLWTHIDYDLSKTGAKKGTIITSHPGHKNIQYFLEQAGKFKYGKPDKLLGSYFTKYKRVPTYSEMYRFFTVAPETKGAKSGKAYKINPLHQHHQELMAKEPAKSIQLTLSKQNTEASRILNQFEKGAKGYSFTEANQKLKDLGVRIKGSKGWMGPAKGEITTAKSIKAAQAETIKMFKEAYKNNPKIVDQMTKALKIAKTAKGPAKFKAIQTIIATVGIGAAASLFDKFGIQPAMADTGVAAPGITGGDIALAGAAPLATKKGRGLYKKALSGASKILSTTPGFVGLETFLGPGVVASMGGSFGETLAAPFLLEGPMRNRRIYNKLKDEGLDTKDIEIVKESLMLDADPFMSSMMPVSKEAISPKIRGIATNAYNWASSQIDEEDKARLERADKFDYLQDVGFADGGIASLMKKK